MSLNSTVPSLAKVTSKSNLDMVALGYFFLKLSFIFRISIWCLRFYLFNFFSVVVTKDGFTHFLFNVKF